MTTSPGDSKAPIWSMRRRIGIEHDVRTVLERIAENDALVASLNDRVRAGALRESVRSLLRVGVPLTFALYPVLSIFRAVTRGPLTPGERGVTVTFSSELSFVVFVVANTTLAVVAGLALISTVTSREQIIYPLLRAISISLLARSDPLNDDYREQLARQLGKASRRLGQLYRRRGSRFGVPRQVRQRWRLEGKASADAIMTLAVASLGRESDLEKVTDAAARAVLRVDANDLGAIPELRLSVGTDDAAVNNTLRERALAFVRTYLVLILGIIGGVITIIVKLAGP